MDEEHTHEWVQQTGSAWNTEGLTTWVERCAAPDCSRMRRGYRSAYGDVSYRILDVPDDPPVGDGE